MKYWHSSLILGLIGILVIIVNIIEQNPYFTSGAILMTAIYLLRALYLFLLDSAKGRKFLRKFPFKWLHKRIERYETGDQFQK